MSLTKVPVLFNNRYNRYKTMREVQSVGDISIIFPCSFAVGITQQYGIYVLLG